MVFSLFEYLDQVNCNHRLLEIKCYRLAFVRINFTYLLPKKLLIGKFFTKKNAITFDLTKIRKKIYFICMKLCCASNGAIKNFKIARKKKINFFFLDKIVIFSKITDFLKTTYIFGFVLPIISNTYLSV